MRDPARLDRFYRELKDIHKEYLPDWRFGQFMINFLSAADTDPFFWEENKFIEKAREYAKKVTGR